MKPEYIRYKNVSLAGASYEDKNGYIKDMSINTKVILKDTTYNNYDKHAISVSIEKEGKLLSVGYIPKKIARKIYYYLNKGYQFHKVIVTSIKREPFFNRTEGHRIVYTFVMDIMLNYNQDKIIDSELNEDDRKFYFRKVFEKELKERMYKIKKKLPLYQFQERDESYLRKIKKMNFYSKDFLDHLGFDDFAAPSLEVNKLLKELDIGITVEEEDYKLSLFYKGLPLRDSDLLSDFQRLVNY